MSSECWIADTGWWLCVNPFAHSPKMGSVTKDSERQSARNPQLKWSVSQPGVESLNYSVAIFGTRSKVGWQTCAERSVSSQSTSLSQTWMTFSSSATAVAWTAVLDQFCGFSRHWKQTQHLHESHDMAATSSSWPGTLRRCDRPHRPHRLDTIEPMLSTGCTGGTGSATRRHGDVIAAMRRCSRQSRRHLDGVKRRMLTMHTHRAAMAAELRTGPARQRRPFNPIRAMPIIELSKYCVIIIIIIIIHPFLYRHDVATSEAVADKLSNHSVFLFSFFRFLVKYFQLCICIVTSLLPFVVNKAYHYGPDQTSES